MQYAMDINNQVFAGRFNRPQWVLNQPLNTWGQIPTVNVLADLNTRYNPDLNPNYPGLPEWFGDQGGTFARIITGWCGASFNPELDELRIPPPAGHADYCGGEPYNLYTRTENPQFKMMYPPAGALPNPFITNDGQEATGLYANGRCRAVHSYNRAIWIPGYGHALIPQGSTSHSGQNGTLRPILFDQDSGEMSLFGEPLDVGSPGDYSGGCSCWDSLRQAVWVRRLGSGVFHRWHPATRTWTKNVSASMATTGNGTCEYIPEFDCIMWLNTTFANANEVAVVNCATGQITRKPISGNAVGMVLNGFCQPRRFAANQFACWNNSSDTTQINVLSFDTHPINGNWSVTQLPVASDNAVTPTTAATTGTYGRFWHSPRMGILATLNDVSQRPYFYRYK